MDWPLVIAAVFAAWVALSLIGYERQRRLDAEAVAPPAVVPPAEIPTLSANGIEPSPARRAA